MPKYLLSIDGGGIRGIIPAVLLAQLEGITGKPCQSLFSFMAGTSTGAIIVSALAAGISAEKIVDLYVTRAAEIFSASPFRFLKRFLKGYMYPSDKLHKILVEESGDAGNWSINEAPVDLLITAKRVIDGRPWYFVKDKHKINSCRTGKVKIFDAVTASSAAPTYFSPWEVTKTLTKNTGPESLGMFVDGGVGVSGNPVYQACVEAFNYAGYSPENTKVISLGTGRFEKKSLPNSLLSWGGWVLDELLQSPGEQQTELVTRHFKNTSFYRIDPDLQELDPELTGSIALDDVKAIPKLYELGKQFASMVDWQSIIADSNKTFRVGVSNAEWWEYKEP